MDRAPSGATTPGQSGPGSDGNEGVLHIPQSSSTAGTSPSDCLVSYPGHSLGGVLLQRCSQCILRPQLTGQVYIYIYIYMCVCVCVCVYNFSYLLLISYLGVVTRNLSIYQKLISSFRFGLWKRAHRYKYVWAFSIIRRFRPDNRPALIFLHKFVICHLGFF